MSTGMSSILLGIIVISFLGGLSNRRESFISPGSFPTSVTRPLLSDAYQEKVRRGLSAYSGSTAWPFYPSYQVGNYAQETNNKRYWPLPCNGWSIPPTTCGNMYVPKTFEPTQPSPPPDNCRRVNYYCGTI